MPTIGGGAQLQAVKQNTGTVTEAVKEEAAAGEEGGDAAKDAPAGVIGGAGEGAAGAATATPTVVVGEKSAVSAATGTGSSLGGGLLRIDTSRVRENNPPALQVNQAPAAPGANGNANEAADTGPAAGVQDSLSLQQLKRLVGEGGRIVQPEYAFEYASSQDLITELSEWFTYNAADLVLVIGGAKQTFEEVYTTLSLPPHQMGQPQEGRKQSHWITSKDVKRRRFIGRCVDLLDDARQEERVKGLEALSYIAQGCYGETHNEGEQVELIKKNVVLLRKGGVVEGLYNCLRKALTREWDFAQVVGAAAQGSGEPPEQDEFQEQKAWNRRELKQAMTVLYFMVETTRQVSAENIAEEDAGLDPELEAFRDEIAVLGEGGLLGFLLKTLARVRWDDNVDLPLMNLMLLAQKTLLLQFGAPETHLQGVKRFARVAAGLDPEVDKSVISANPLDFYLFRQDLIAKYPAYEPPKSLFPFDVASFLPSLSEREATRSGGNTDILLGGRGNPDNLTSILDKAVHIATPAPSPPPSPVPAAGGKMQKKHNYQTNNQFPFLYPPTTSAGDSSASSQMWWREDGAGDGACVPTSIKEAGDLFSSRLRVTLAMKQLWQEKEAFDKARRGWSIGEEEAELEKERWVIENREPRWEEKRLRSVRDVYETILPQLQSLVHVMFKIMLQSIPTTPPPPPPTREETMTTHDETAPNGTTDFAPSSSTRTSWSLFGKTKPPLSSSSSRPTTASILSPISEAPPPPAPTLLQQTLTPTSPASSQSWLDLDTLRTREITASATTSLLLNLLKFFRVSHILKFEYLTALLLDANYIPLVLKILNNHEPTILTTITDRPERAYLRICNLHSLNPKPLPPISSPPPPPPPAEATPDPPSSPNSSPPPMVTTFNPRTFFTIITLLRILVKIIKSHPHRILMLVSYKSSILLRKTLKTPQKDLRLYTLKLFKAQVPYCGRKWRQSNMRIITQVYLFCRPELRDEWLAAGDVEETVEGAGVGEVAGRVLGEYFHGRRWRGVMMGEEKRGDGEEGMGMGFFERELERVREAGGTWEGGEEGEWE